MISNPMSVRRPVGLYRIFFRDQPLFSRGDIYRPDSAVRITSDGWIQRTFVSTGDLFPIRRPSRIETEICQPLDTLARRPHQEYASAFSLRAKGNAITIGRERRLRIIGSRILRQVDGILSAHPLKIDIPITGSVAGIND